MAEWYCLFVQPKLKILLSAKTSSQPPTLRALGEPDSGSHARRTFKRHPRSRKFWSPDPERKRKKMGFLVAKILTDLTHEGCLPARRRRWAACLEVRLWQGSGETNHTTQALTWVSKVKEERDGNWTSFVPQETTVVSDERYHLEPQIIYFLPKFWNEVGLGFCFFLFLGFLFVWGFSEWGGAGQ